MNKPKYYKVTTKCGHVRKRRYIPITFAIKANSGKEAASIARQIPRVKHTDKYAILECTEISYETYCDIKEENKHNPYLMSRTIQEQRKNFETIYKHIIQTEPKKKRKDRNSVAEYTRRKNKIKERWHNTLLANGVNEYYYQTYLA